jgi:hypothetical protein
MTVVDVLGTVDELADGMGGSVDAVTGAAIGPYQKSRLGPYRESWLKFLYITEEEDMATPALDRGHAGEQSMGFYWGERGYFLVDGPSGAGGHPANAAGFDGIAFNPDTGHMVIYDNKALARAGNVYSATAISENLAKNLDTLHARVAARPDIPQQGTILANISDARAALTPGSGAGWPRNVQLAVSNASGQSAGVGGKLANGTIKFIDYYAAPSPAPGPGPSETPQPMAINLNYSVRGQANGSAMVVLFMVVDGVANYINGYFREAEVHRATQLDLQSVRDWQKKYPADGALLVITFRRTVLNSEFMQNKVMLHPGDAFEYTSLYFGERPEDAAKQMAATREFVQGDTIDGPYKTIRRKQAIWIAPRQGPDQSAFMSPVGRWQVKIGDWNGLFVFKQNGSCSWSEGGPEHPGTWKIAGGEVQWTYSDDPKGWERIFHARLPLRSKVSGEATINGVNHGYYTMAKQA